MVGMALRVVVLAVIAVAMVAGKEGKTVKKQLRAEPEPDAPEVQLSVGWMSGRWMRTRAGRTVAAFTKIPYAQPPVEELRFKVGDVYGLPPPFRPPWQSCAFRNLLVSLSSQRDVTVTDFGKNFEEIKIRETCHS